jgi:Tfp pilus assembly protein PilF
MKKLASLVVLVSLVALAACCTTAPNQNANPNPNQTQRLLGQAVDSLKQGDTARYKEIVQKAYADDPNDPFVINNMGLVAEMDGNTHQAKEYYWLAWQRADSLTVLTTNDGQYQGKLLKDVALGNFERIKSNN